MLRHQVTLKTTLPYQVARTTLLSWLQANGYRLTSAPFLSAVDASRGSWSGNMGSLDPRRWLVRFQASFTKEDDGCTIEMDWAVTTAGQIVMKPDIAYWEREVEDTLKVVLGGRPDMQDLAKMGVKTYRSNVWRASLFALALGVPLFGVWFATGSLLYGVIAGTVVSTAAWLALKAPRTLEVEIPKVSLAPPPAAQTPPTQVPPTQLPSSQIPPSQAPPSTMPPPIQGR